MRSSIATFGARIVAAVAGLILLATTPAAAQGLGGAGTVQGTVQDPTGGVMVSVLVVITSPVSGFRREATTDTSGRFVFRNLPPNAYHLSVSAQGFQPLDHDLDVRTSVPIELTLALELASAASTVEVVGHAMDLIERDPTAHTDIDQTLLNKLPLEPVSGLNQVITLASPGVVADANGFFHPIGDHAQTQFFHAELLWSRAVTEPNARLQVERWERAAVAFTEVVKTGKLDREIAEDVPSKIGAEVERTFEFKDQEQILRGTWRAEVWNGRRRIAMRRFAVQ